MPKQALFRFWNHTAAPVSLPDDAESLDFITDHIVYRLHFGPRKMEIIGALCSYSDNLNEHYNKLNLPRFDTRENFDGDLMEVVIFGADKKIICVFVLCPIYERLSDLHSGTHNQEFIVTERAREELGSVEPFDEDDIDPQLSILCPEEILICPVRLIRNYPYFDRDSFVRVVSDAPEDEILTCLTENLWTLVSSHGIQYSPETSAVPKIYRHFSGLSKISSVVTTNVDISTNGKSFQFKDLLTKLQQKFEQLVSRSHFSKLLDLRMRTILIVAHRDCKEKLRFLQKIFEA